MAAADSQQGGVATRHPQTFVSQGSGGLIGNKGSPHPAAGMSGSYPQRGMRATPPPQQELEGGRMRRRSSGLICESNLDEGLVTGVARTSVFSDGGSPSGSSSLGWGGRGGRALLHGFKDSSSKHAAGGGAAGGSSSDVTTYVDDGGGTGESRWTTIEGEFVSVMVVVTPVRSDKTLKGEGI